MVHPQIGSISSVKMKSLYQMKSLVACIGVLFLMGMSTSGFSQKGLRPEVDSIFQVANDLPTEKEQVAKAMQAVKKMQSYSVDSTIVLLDSLIEVYEKRNSRLGIGRAISLKSWFVIFDARYEESLLLAHEALTILKQENDSLGIALSLLRIGLGNIMFERYEQSEDYLLQSLDLFVLLKDTTRIDLAYNNLGVLYSELQDEYKAIENYKKSLAIRRQIPDYEFWVAYSLYNIGNAFLELNEIDSAGHYYFKAENIFRTQTPSKKVPAMVQLGLASYYHQAGDLPKAIEYAESGLKKAYEQNLTEMITEGHYILAQAQNEMGRYREAFKNLEDYGKLKSREDSLNNIGRVAEVEAKYNTAKKEQELAAMEAQMAKDALKVKQANSILVWISAAALILVLLVVFGFVRKQQAQNLHATKLEAGLAEVRMMALRAQMNPHFIFNCINTAQNFVLGADKEGAYEYLAKFAQLLRSVLVNSGKIYVSLEDELKQAQLYAELEQVRFSEKFDFDLKVDPELENGVFEVPGMVLQPFIENAILHGLVNKPEGERGRLSLQLQLDNDRVVCHITDNGVGRKRAMEIKKQKATHYQSAALPNITERFDLLRRSSEKDIRFTITDLEKNGKAVGTQIRIELPFQ